MFCKNVFVTVLCYVYPKVFVIVSDAHLWVEKTYAFLTARKSKRNHILASLWAKSAFVVYENLFSNFLICKWKWTSGVYVFIFIVSVQRIWKWCPFFKICIRVKKSSKRICVRVIVYSCSVQCVCDSCVLRVSKSISDREWRAFVSGTKSYAFLTARNITFQQEIVILHTHLCRTKVYLRDSDRAEQWILFYCVIVYSCRKLKQTHLCNQWRCFPLLHFKRENIYVFWSGMLCCF